MSGELVDPDTAAGVAEAVMERALALAVDLDALGRAAAGSASAAAASLAAFKAAIAGLGLPVLWSGTSLQIRLPDGSYTPAVDLRGLQGPVGPMPTFRVGQKLSGPLDVSIDSSDPLNPIFDITVPPGDRGWSAVLANVAVGAAVVQRVVDWTGGSGAKPAVGLYLGPAGLVADPAQATNVRGAPGPSAASFVGASATPLPIATGNVAVVLSAATRAAYAPTVFQALVSASDPTVVLIGVYGGGYDAPSGTLPLAIVQAAGSGTHADWIVTSTPPLFVPTGIDGGYAGDPYPPPGASPVYGAATNAVGVDGGYA